MVKEKRFTLQKIRSFPRVAWIRSGGFESARVAGLGRLAGLVWAQTRLSGACLAQWKPPNWLARDLPGWRPGTPWMAENASWNIGNGLEGWKRPGVPVWAAWRLSGRPGACLEHLETPVWSLPGAVETAQLARLGPAWLVPSTAENASWSIGNGLEGWKRSGGLVWAAWRLSGRPGACLERLQGRKISAGAWK